MAPIHIGEGKLLGKQVNELSIDGLKRRIECTPGLTSDTDTIKITTQINGNDVHVFTGHEINESSLCSKFSAHWTES